MLFIWIINGIIISVMSGFTYTLLFNSDTNITDLLFKFRVQEVIYNIWIVMTFIVSIRVFKKTWVPASLEGFYEMKHLPKCTAGVLILKHSDYNYPSLLPSLLRIRVCHPQQVHQYT